MLTDSKESSCYYFSFHSSEQLLFKPLRYEILKISSNNSHILRLFDRCSLSKLYLLSHKKVNLICVTFYSTKYNYIALNMFVTRIELFYYDSSFWKLRKDYIFETSKAVVPLFYLYIVKNN